MIQLIIVAILVNSYDILIEIPGKAGISGLFL